MGIITYALFAYLLTAILSLIVVAIIVAVSKFTDRTEVDEGKSVE